MSREPVPGNTEAGMTMIELMVSLVVFAIAATAIAAGLITTLQSTKQSRNRLQAASLASREVEILRNEFLAASGANVLALGAVNLVTNPHPLPGQTVGAPLTVDGSPYVVTRNVEWLPAGTGQSACDGGASLTYPSLAVNVSVSWPQMGRVKPVESNTVLTPKKNTLATTTSFVGVKIVSSAGAPVPGLTATLTGPGGTYTDTTASDGCAVFALTTPGTYTASLNTSGAYVDKAGLTNPTQSVTVASSALVQKTFNYDRAVSVAVTLATDAGYSLPTTRPQPTFYNSGIAPLGVKTYASTGATTTIGGLWPYVDGYALWAGSCRQSDPSVSGGTRDPAVVPAPGASASRTVRLAPVDLTVAQLGVPIAGAVVKARPASTTSCVAADTPITLGTTDSSGRLRSSLPAGTWILETTVGGDFGTTTTGTVLQTSPVTSYLLSVI